MNGPTVAFVFARGGSKGVPRKNIRRFLGRPLIARSIDVARQSKLIDRIVVSTDDAEIAEIALQCGAEVPFLRPAELSSDHASELLAWKHAISTLQAAGDRIGRFVSLPATSPLRSVDDVEGAIRLLETESTDLVISVTPARRHPMYNMVSIGGDGLVGIACPPEKPIIRRQDAPEFFDVCTVVYAARPEFILGADSLLSGRTRAVIVPPERSLDIDTEFDFMVAEAIAERIEKVHS